jgi:hypothetical protein
MSIRIDNHWKPSIYKTKKRTPPGSFYCVIICIGFLYFPGVHSGVVVGSGSHWNIADTRLLVKRSGF